ncbi:MAG: VRR-NUC domain-containing protein [Candidatus Woesearchaeota archaeon]|nr:VRR-NUC domain-containing protein [Candidatus Woesearchaeota archaeon]
MQRSLREFTQVLVPHVFIPNTSNARRRGLSERMIKKRLERDGWLVWRGSLVGAHKDESRYPNVRRKYAILHELLEQHHPDKISTLEYMCYVHHGIPDLLCFRKSLFKFVECKLGHEQLSQRQKTCIRKLQELGFPVEVHKLVDDCTKTRRATIDLHSGEKIIHEKQERLRRKYAKRI